MHDFNERQPIAYGRCARTMLLSTSIIATLLLVESYNAVLLASLMRPASPNEIRSLQDAVTKSRARVFFSHMDQPLTDYIRYNAAQRGSLFETLSKENRLVECPVCFVTECGSVEKDFLLCGVFFFDG